MSVEFFKIQIMPPPTVALRLHDPFPSPSGWFVVIAADPYEGGDGRSYFAHLEITTNPLRAAVFPPFTARNILAILSERYTAAALVPATFSDWIDAMPARS